MQITAGELCKILGGTLEGDAQIVIHGPSKIEEGSPGTISFLANPKYESYIYDTAASAILVQNDFKPTSPLDLTLIRVEDVYKSIAFLLEKFGTEEAHALGISEQADIAKNAKIEDGVTIGAFSVIGTASRIGKNAVIFPQVYIGDNVQIGAGVKIYPGVRIYSDTVIEENCVVHANAVIGKEGFGFAKNEDGSYKKIAQIGNVHIEAGCEIGANTVIDRATMGSTRIKAGVKLDNLIQIAHNVELGAHTAIAAQTGIAGSTKVGANCMIGGQTAIAGHIKIADGAQIQGNSGIAGNVEKPNSRLYGYPAIDYYSYLRSYSVFKNLPEILKRIQALEKQSGKE